MTQIVIEGSNKALAAAFGKMLEKKLVERQLPFQVRVGSAEPQEKAGQSTTAPDDEGAP